MRAVRTAVELIHEAAKDGSAANGACAEKPPITYGFSASTIDMEREGRLLPCSKKFPMEVRLKRDRLRGGGHFEVCDAARNPNACEFCDEFPFAFHGIGVSGLSGRIQETAMRFHIYSELQRPGAVACDAFFHFEWISHGRPRVAGCGIGGEGCMLSRGACICVRPPGIYRWLGDDRRCGSVS